LIFAEPNELLGGELLCADADELLPSVVARHDFLRTGGEGGKRLETTSQ
jgi:hypothetical protein